MSRLHAPFTALALSVFLAACGGGDGDSDPADKYVGTWDIPCEVDGSESFLGEVTLSKSGAELASGPLTFRIFGNTTCSGTPTATVTLQASVNVQGTAEIGGKKVDKVIAKLGNDTSKDVYYVTGNQWFESPDNAPKDGDGFPTTLDLSVASTKR